MNNFILLHSFHFLNKQNYSLCNKTYNIVDQNNNKLCGLLNIPTHKKLYTPKLVKLIANPFHNLKIEIEVNYDYLYKLILTSTYISSKKELIKLLKKKYWTTKNFFNDSITYSNIQDLNYDENEYIKKNCIQIKDIIINLETEEFFILNSFNRSKFFLKNKGIQGIFYSKPYKNIIQQLSDCTILKSIFKNNRNLIITSDTNKEFLKCLNEIKIVKKKDDLLKNIYKFTVIYEKFYENNSVEINSIKWNSVIFLNIENEDQFDNYINIKSDNKFIFFNSLKDHNFINQHFNYFQILINPNLCFINRENLCKFKNKIYYLKQKELKFKKKHFTLQSVDKKFISEIDYETLELFYSLKENFMYYSLIDFSIFKENKFLKDKLYDDNNKYKNPECVICYNTISKNSLLYTVCNHYFCENCIITHFKHNLKLCPLCRKEIDSGSLLKIRYNKKTNYASNKLKYILSLKNDDVLIISYFSKSIQKLRHILENYNHTNNYTLVNINSIEKLHTVNKSNKFSKVLFLEDHGEHFNYYQYYINSFKFIQKKNINILAIKY